MTEETRIRTREHFAANARECKALALRGELRVNDLEKYVKKQDAQVATILAGGWDHTFTFMQRAHWLETGEETPLFRREGK